MNSFSGAEKKEEFETEVRRSFGFLERDERMKQGAVSAEDDSHPRDAYLTVRFSRQDLIIDVHWLKAEKLLAIGVEFKRDDLPPKERCVPFEDFVEYLSDGRQKAIIPRYGHGVHLATVTRRRNRAFAEGLPAVMAALASKLKANLRTLENASSDAIRRYLTRPNSDGT